MTCCLLVMFFGLCILILSCPSYRLPCSAGGRDGFCRCTSRCADLKSFFNIPACCLGCVGGCTLGIMPPTCILRLTFADAKTNGNMGTFHHGNISRISLRVVHWLKGELTIFELAADLSPSRGDAPVESSLAADLLCTPVQHGGQDPHLLPGLHHGAPIWSRRPTTCTRPCPARSRLGAADHRDGLLPATRSGSLATGDALISASLDAR